MLPKKFRLKNKYAFTATYHVNNSYHLAGVTLFCGKKKFLKNNEPTNVITTKVGFVVGKKTHKRAVKRNRIKRLMRESYRLSLKNDNLGKSQDFMSLIFVGHSGALGKNFKEMNSIILKLLQRVK